MLRKVLFLVTLLPLLWAPFIPASGRPLGATVTVIEPDGVDDVIGESDDYATLALGDPWDMNERNDIRWSNNIANIYASSGVWYGTGSGSDPGFFTPFQGLVGAATVGKIGANYAIDTSRYTRLTFRVYATGHNNVEVLWFSSPATWSWAGKLWNYNQTPQGWRTYDFDLTDPQVCPACKAGDPWQANPWVYGIRIDPTTASDAQLAVDWVRLSDPSSSPSYAIVWSGQGNSASLFFDDDGDTIPCNTRVPITLDIDNTGSYSWTPNLPPGEYYIYVEVDGSGSCSPGPLTIDHAPVLRFLAPSMTSGEDYALSSRGDLWDMSDEGDIENTHHIADIAFASGALHGATTGSDSQILLPVEGPIDADRYRFLTYRMLVDGSQDVAQGWVSRVLFWTNHVNIDGNTTNDLIVYEGWTTYHVDLKRVSLDDEDPGLGPGWVGSKMVFRFDPVENVPTGTGIHIDYVRLTAIDQADTSFRIAWELIDPGDTATVSLYYDTDRAGFDGQLIAILTDQASTGSTSFRSRDIDASLPARAQAQQEVHRAYLPLVAKNFSRCPGLCYNWDTVSVPAGEYYIYAVVEDDHNVTRWYSETPVIISH